MAGWSFLGFYIGGSIIVEGELGQPGLLYNICVMQQLSGSHSTDSPLPNTSGQGNSSILPPELQGWNWGAFLLTWIWGIDNKVWLALLALIPIPILRLAFAVFLGIKGNEWAWQSKKWESVEQFRRRQRIWLIWGIISLLLPVLLIIGIIMIITGILGYYGLIKF